MTVAWAPELATMKPRRNSVEYLHPRVATASPPSPLCVKMKRRRWRAQAALTTGAPSLGGHHHQHNEEKTMLTAMPRKRINSTAEEEKLDRWMWDSVAEIVRNIGDAPFLVQIFSLNDEDLIDNNESGASCSRIKKERIQERSRENWRRIKRRWEHEKCVPDGVVLVEELVTPLASPSSQAEEKRTWGLVVQGRDMMCPPACYVLNTCRIPSSVGFCTHFCLVRAQCFGEALDAQIRNAWLHDGP